jgi:hypothetical protein
MIRYDVAQGSEEWRRLRMGVPTASAFDRILTPKGKRSGQSGAYMYDLLAELALGRPLDAEAYPWMVRGSQLEAEAVKWYEFQNDIKTEVVGFCTTDDGLIGASPDRLVGSDGEAEFKCPSPSVHLGYLLFPQHGVDAEYHCQVQGQLLVTERQWCHVVSYHPDFPKVTVPVERDEPYIALQREALYEFCAKLAKGKAELERRGLLAAPPETRPQTTRDAIDHYLGEAF